MQTGRNNLSTPTNNQRNPTRRTPYDRPAAPTSNNNDNHTHSYHQSSNSNHSRGVDEDDFDDIDIPDDELDEGQEGQDEDGFGDLQLTQEDLDDLDSFMSDHDEDNDEIEDDKGDNGVGDIHDRTLVKKEFATLTTRAGREEVRARNPTVMTTTTNATTATNLTPARPVPTVRPVPTGRSAPTAAAPTPSGSKGQITTQQAYKAFLERIRTGKEPVITHQSGSTTYRDLIRIPDQFLFTPVALRRSGTESDYYDAQRKFLLEIYPGLAAAPKHSQSVMENVILTHRKDIAE
ncbi:hypothetical protein BGZ95_002548, partial [Linnemannia exigua]